jgi:hypothetical protein
VYAHAHGANTVLALFAVLRWIILRFIVILAFVFVLLSVGEWDAVVCSDVVLTGLVLIAVLCRSILRLFVILAFVLLETWL